MKLYRGIKSEEITFFTDEVKSDLDSVMGSIIQMREVGDFTYPDNMNSEIIKAHKQLRLKDQYFTDRKDIAEGYAKSGSGSLLEIDVPNEEILEHFKVEFQDFGKRKTDFQLVYRVDGKTLLKKSSEWKLKQNRGFE